MDNNTNSLLTEIRNKELETDSKILNETESNTNIFYCSKCSKNMEKSEFMTNGKFFKTCNNCRNKYMTKSTKKPKIIMPKVPTKINKNSAFDNLPKTDVMTSKLEEITSPPNVTPVELEKDLKILNDVTKPDIKIIQLNETQLKELKNEELKMSGISLQKINDYENLLGLPLTTEAIYNLKSDQEKGEYVKLLMLKMSDIFSKKFNPGTYLLLAFADIIEKNAHLTQQIGYDVDLTGFQKELYTHKPEIDDAMAQILVDYPNYVKYMMNPFCRLGLIMVQSGINTINKNKETYSKNISNIGSNIEKVSNNN